MAVSLPITIPHGNPKLLEQVRDVLRRKHYSIRTEQTYTDWHVKASLTCRRIGITKCKVFYVYGLRSECDSGFYIGFSRNLRARFRQHKVGESAAISHRGPWTLIYYEAYRNQADALGCEKYLKSGAGREAGSFPYRCGGHRPPLQKKGSGKQGAPGTATPLPGRRIIGLNRVPAKSHSAVRYWQSVNAS